MTRHLKRPMRCIAAAALAICTWPAMAAAMDLNSFRAANGRAPLRSDAMLAGAASSHASALARRGKLDHSGFRDRAAMSGGTSAENVSFGCADEACAIRQWSRSGRHRANMLRRDVSGYGLASATADNGRRYWVLELGN